MSLQETWEIVKCHVRLAFCFVTTEAVPHRYSAKKALLTDFAKLQKNRCVAGCIPATFLKETLIQVFSCIFCKIFHDTFFVKHPRVTASVTSLHMKIIC